MTASVLLPRADGSLDRYTAKSPPPPAPSSEPLHSRVVYAAAHVVVDPFAEQAPGAPPPLDWDATLAFRRHLWDHGLGVAEAMDTAQRGMGLGWDTATELIRRSVTDARAAGGAMVSGAGTDHLPDTCAWTLDEVARAYEEQCTVVEDVGGRIVLMASRALAAAARDADDYAAVYDRVLSQVGEPVVLHWLGPMFDPALAGYWGSDDLDEAAAACVKIVENHVGKIDGIKVSLLEAEREVALRERLPEGVRCYTGDDFHYPALVRGDARGHSHALLGVFDAIAATAAAAVRALDAGDVERYDALLEPTIPLARHIFGAPTYFYKTGIVFLAYLNGYQDHFRMVGGLESARSIPHLAELFVLADRAGVLADAELATERMRRVLALAGVEQ